MYTKLFKLREPPFRLTPDPQFLFKSTHHARAKAYMESTVWFQDGFVVLTGEIGSGKTTLIETFLQELDRDVVVAQVNQTQVSATEFLQAVLVQFGFSPFAMKKAELLATLNSFLVEQYSAGRKVLLIVDEAQNLGLRVLEEIRMLSGIETTKEKVLRIILVGQPELNAKLDSPELIQLAQRVRLRFHLTPLSEEDMRAYVLHRLEVAGAGGRAIFAEACYPLLYRYTGGVPRLINTLCETAMIAAFGEDRDRVNAGDLRTAIAELGWVDYAARRAAIEQAQRAHAAALAKPAPPAPPAAATASTADSGVVAILEDLPPPSVPPPLAQSELAQPLNPPPAPVLPVRPVEDAVPAPTLYVADARSVNAVLANITVLQDGMVLGQLPLKPGRVVVGRTADNDLQIDSRLISRHHCQLLTTGESTVIEDLGSTNGVIIGGRRLKRRILKDGDVLQLGAHALRYQDVRQGEDVALADLPPLEEGDAAA